MTTSEVAMADTNQDAAIVAQFLEEASVAVGVLADETARVADLFRRLEVKAGNERLAVLPAELRNFIVMVNVVEGQLATDPAGLRVDDLAPQDQITRLGRWLQALVDAQASDDPLTIADILEFDLQPFLRAWAALLPGQTPRAYRRA